jgi:hypothetical protein
VSRNVASPETDDSKGVTIHIVSTPNQHKEQQKSSKKSKKTIKTFADPQKSAIIRTLGMTYTIRPKHYVTPVKWKATCEAANLAGCRGQKGVGYSGVIKESLVVAFDLVRWKEEISIRYERNEHEEEEAVLCVNHGSCPQVQRSEPEFALHF